MATRVLSQQARGFPAACTSQVFNEGRLPINGALQSGRWQVNRDIPCVCMSRWTDPTQVYELCSRKAAVGCQLVSTMLREEKRVSLQSLQCRLLKL